MGMEIASKYKGRTMKSALVTGVTTEEEPEILAFALKACGETKSSLFGWYVDRNLDGTYSVTMHTD